MNPTSLTIDPATGRIMLPVGGTGSFIARLSFDEEIEINKDDCIVLFSMSKAKNIGVQQHRAAIITKRLELNVDEEGELYVQVTFVNADTRELKPGNYVWDLTIITDPETLDDGSVVVEDDSDNVIPIFARTGALPMITLCEVTYIV